MEWNEDLKPVYISCASAWMYRWLIFTSGGYSSHIGRRALCCLASDQTSGRSKCYYRDGCICVRICSLATPGIPDGISGRHGALGLTITYTVISLLAHCTFHWRVIRICQSWTCIWTVFLSVFRSVQSAAVNRRTEYREEMYWSLRAP